MRDVAEVAREPEVFEQTATERCGPSSVVSPHLVLWPPRPRQCPSPAVDAEPGRGCPAWGWREERGAESGSPRGGVPGAAAVAPAASQGGKSVNCTHLGVNITVQGVGKKSAESSRIGNSRIMKLVWISSEYEKLI